MKKERIERINELYKKSKETGLTEAEKKEQEELRREYIDSFKDNLKQQLQGLKHVKPGEEKENRAVILNHTHDENCSCGQHHHIKKRNLKKN